MDCRKSLLLALGLLTGAAGCSSLLPVQPAGTEAAAAGEEKLHKPETYAAFANYRATAGFTQGVDPAAQQQYREDARRSYLKAIEIDRKYLPAYIGMLKLQQACEDHAGAVATCEQAVQLAPEDATLWFELGMCQCRIKNWNSAVQALRKACELDPANRQYATMFGFTLARAGMYNDSFYVLSRLNGEGKAHADLARMLNHLNQPQLAREQAVLALTKDPSAQSARTLLASLDKPVAAPAPSPAPAEKHDNIQIVSYTEPASSRPVQQAAPANNSATPEEGNGRAIQLPPPPVISIHSRGD
jgi:tetratricopeptide (TPR) repeat protein